jgi:hypothetical protein
MTIKFKNEASKTKFLNILHKAATSEQAHNLVKALENADKLADPGVITDEEMAQFKSVFESYVHRYEESVPEKFPAGQWSLDIFPDYVTESIAEKSELTNVIHELEAAEVTGDDKKSDPSTR